MVGNWWLAMTTAEQDCLRHTWKSVFYRSHVLSARACLPSFFRQIFPHHPLIMKSLLTFLLSALCLSTATSALVTKTFHGVTTKNWVYSTSALAAEFPVGTAWTLKLGYDTASAPLYQSSAQAQYRLTELTITLQGVSGPWTTSSLPGQAAFTLNQGGAGSADSIQFTSGWGPAAHSNPKIADMEPYSINLTLSDPGGSAIAALSPAPSGIDQIAWSPRVEDSYLKIYLNSAANLYLIGALSATAADTTKPTVKVTSSSQALRRLYTLAARLADNVRPVAVRYRLKAPSAKTFGRWSSWTKLVNTAKSQNWSKRRIELSKLGTWQIQVQARDAARNTSFLKSFSVKRVP